MMDDLLTPRRVGADRFTVEIPAGWRQGRGAFGGLVLGMLTRAMEASMGKPEPGPGEEAAAPERALRSLTGTLCGPALVGPAEIAVEILRAGTGVTTAAARLVQKGEVLAHTVGVLGRARDRALDRTAIDAPNAPPWRDVEPLPELPGAAEFARFFEFRNTGPLPFSGAREALASGWIRRVGPRASLDAAWLIACADAWWPALFAVVKAPRPMATIAFTFEPLASRESLGETDAPLFHRARLLSARDGYAVELRELWSEDGRLLATNHQTFVLIA